jgi:hypothetical protein
MHPEDDDGIDTLRNYSLVILNEALRIRRASPGPSAYRLALGRRKDTVHFMKMVVVDAQSLRR